MFNSNKRPLNEGPQQRELLQQRTAALLEPVDDESLCFHDDQYIYWLL